MSLRRAVLKSAAFKVPISERAEKIKLFDLCSAPSENLNRLLRTTAVARVHDALVHVGLRRKERLGEQFISVLRKGALSEFSITHEIEVIPQTSGPAYCWATAQRLRTRSPDP